MHLFELPGMLDNAMSGGYSGEVNTSCDSEPLNAY